jgi:putative transposase
MITYRGKATKISKSAKRELRNAAKRATRYFNTLLSSALAYFDAHDKVIAANPLKIQCPKPKELSTYHSEPVVERVVCVMKRYAEGEIGRPRLKNVQRARWSLAITVYTQVSKNVLVSMGMDAQSAKIAIPGTQVILNLRTDKRKLQGEIKRLSVVCDSCGDVWVNIATDAEIPFFVEEAECVELGVDQGIREYAVGASRKSDGTLIKLTHERTLSDIGSEMSCLENAQRNEDWRGVKHISRRIERKRKHYNHVLASDLVRKAENIYIGDVSSRFLFANPSSKIARKAADACHAQLRTYVGQKAARATLPRNACLVYEAYSSKICGFCGKQNNIGSLKYWTCLNCHTWHDRDINAALNMRFCPVREDLVQKWRTQSAKYQKMRTVRKQPRKKEIVPLRRAMTPVGELQNICTPESGAAYTASPASLSIY